MDNQNQPQAQIPTVQTPPQVVNQPMVQPAPPLPPQKNNKMFFSFLAVLAIISIAVFVMFFSTKKQTAVPPSKITAPVVSQVSPTLQPSPLPTQSPDQALQEVILEDPTADIEDINADIKQL